MLTIYFFSFLNDLHSFIQVITEAKREKKIFTDNNVECRIFLFKWLWIELKIIDIECWSRDKYESDFRSNENYLSSSEN